MWLYQETPDNQFQLVGQGNVAFRGEHGTNVFIAPVGESERATIDAPECDESQHFSWNTQRYPSVAPERCQSSQQFDLPELRLRRAGQPEADLFSQPLLVNSGCLTRYVDISHENEGSDIALVDGLWGQGDWLVSPSTKLYQLWGSRHLPLSRFIHRLLQGESITQFQAQDLFDDLFYTPPDSGIWICILACQTKARVMVKIVTPFGQIFLAILELPEQQRRQRSLSPIRVTTLKQDRLNGRRGSTGSDISQSPLAKVSHSASNLFGKLFGSSEGKDSQMLHEPETGHVTLINMAVVVMLASGTQYLK